MTQAEFRQQALKYFEESAQTSIKLNELSDKFDGINSRFEKMELFIYGDPQTKTKGALQELIEVKKDLAEIQGLVKFSRGKVAGFLLALTGFSAIVKLVFDYFSK